MAISRSLMNRQLRADGGIMQVAPREKFGLGSKLKKFVRKIIPNEVADIAVKAAPFVAPFNPAVAAAMAGLGTFDQTGSIGDSLKGGALTYGLGQGARYLGGAGFQGNPFSADGGAFRGGLEGFKGGFTSPLGNQTGFKLGKPVQAVEGVGIDTSVPLKKPTVTESFVTADAAPVKSFINTGIDMQTGGADGFGIIQDTVANKSTVAKEPGFLKNLFDGVSNQDYGKVAQTIGDGAKKFGKAMFTNKDGSIDKNAVLGAITFAASYAEARALAAETGVDDDLTEEEYNEAVKDEKKEEYAGYLTNFFGGVKDGGRIGFKFGTKPEEAEIGIMSIDVEAGDDDEDMMMAGGITFSSAEKSYLFKKLGGAGGSDRSFTMPQLYGILKNPNSPSNIDDAKVLKQIAIMGLGEGQKDGGRIGYKKGANRVSELLILRDELIGKGEDVSDIEAEIFQLTGKTFRSVGGISDVPTGKMRKNNAGVVERDYRDEGGFVPVGIKERADDVPAMLSKNEFVMTADAVRGIGNGSVEEGSKKLYNTMKQAEKVGKA